MTTLRNIFAIAAPVLLVGMGCGSLDTTYGAIPFEEFFVDSTAPVVVDMGAMTLAAGTAPAEINAVELATEVGRPDKGSGQRGGFTATFSNPTDAFVCFVMDPEGRKADLDDGDDGDMDLYVGLESDYTGTPGTVFGDFTSLYTDPLGIDHLDDVNLCIPDEIDFFGRPGAHVGRGDVEYCLIEVQANVNYIVSGETFSVPNNDGNLAFSTAAVPGVTGLPGQVNCPTVNETTLVEDRSP